jgi:hypothetical protein
MKSLRLSRLEPDMRTSWMNDCNYVHKVSLFYIKIRFFD